MDHLKGTNSHEDAKGSSHEDRERQSADAVIRPTDAEALNVQAITEQTRTGSDAASLEAPTARTAQSAFSPDSGGIVEDTIPTSARQSTGHPPSSASSNNSASSTGSPGSADSSASSDGAPSSPSPAQSTGSSRVPSRVIPGNASNSSLIQTDQGQPDAISPTARSSKKNKRPSAKGATVVGGVVRAPLRSLKDMLFKDNTASIPITKPEDKIDRVLTMMRILGTALLRSHQATTDVANKLELIGRAYNMPPVRIVTLPTVIAVQVEGTDRRAEIGGVEGDQLRLDQAAAIDSIVERATRAVIEPDDAIGQVEEIIASKSRFNWAVRIFGQVIITLAIGLLINPALPALPAYLILGLIVGVLIQVGERFPNLNVAMPVICAAIVTVVASEFLTGITQEVPIRLIAPALVTFLPGATLAIAALELTRNEVISGSSRLVYGISQLLLLSFGVVIGMALSPGASTTSEVVINSIGPWTPALGIALMALGYVFSRSAPQGSYLWLVLALALTYSAQRLGLLIVPAEFSGFFGALIVVPLARFLARFRTAPSAIVTQLVSFWILVPGALGFVGFTEAASGSSQTIHTLVTVGMALFSIALGLLVGSSLVRDNRER